MTDETASIQGDELLGLFLVNAGLITQMDLDNALLLKEDNQGRMIGEILVTMGCLTKDNLIMAVEMFMMENDTNDMAKHPAKWLDQEEIDMILAKLKKI